MIETMSLAITNLLLTLPIWEKTYFHIFLPITEQKEVDTELILHLLVKTKKLSFQKLILIVLRFTSLTDTKIKKNA
jgi:5-formyltetrahydrofolate cyclo-ligase